MARPAGKWSAAVALMAAAVSTASAQAESAWGNASGCRFHASGTMENDELLLLTVDAFTTFAAFCTFGPIEVPAGTEAKVTATCANEGEEGTTTEKLMIGNRGDAGHFVRIGDMEPFGPLAPC